MENKKEPKIHVLYYTPGKNMKGLHQIMTNLQKLWGSNVIALPKDVMRLAREEMSLQDLINIRNMFNRIIDTKTHEMNQGDSPTSEENPTSETN